MMMQQAIIQNFPTFFRVTLIWQNVSFNLAERYRSHHHHPVNSFQDKRGFKIFGQKSQRDLA